MNENSEGLFYAALEDGERVPVIDVTHPAFRLDLQPRELERQVMAAVRLRSLDAFSAMTARARWRVTRVMESPLSWEVVCAAGTPADGAP